MNKKEKQKGNDESIVNVLEEGFSELDKANMIDLLEKFPQNIIDALYLGESFYFSNYLSADSIKKIKNIVVLGMGGSAIGGDLLFNYLSGELSIPLIVIRGYKKPKFINANTLIFTISYSGNTEETICALKKCLEVGAKVIGLTSGGTIELISKKFNFPIIKVPTEIQPRVAMPFLFFPVLKVLEKMKLINKQSKDIEETISVLFELSQKYSSKSPLKNNFAKKIARKLYQYLPLVYGSEGLLEAVSMRWKTQINENSKWPCFYNVFPELNHNEIVGFEIKNKINKQIKIIYLFDTEGSSHINQRMKITQNIIGDKVSEFIICSTQGKEKLTRMFSLIYLGDMVSYYLAILNKVDPSPVNYIENLKKELAK